MPSISDFSSNMKKGFARPNLFRVAISKIKVDKQRDYQMRCFQAQIPGHNIATTDKDIGFRSIAYQKIFSDVILGFYVDSDLSQLKFWQEWIDQIVNKNTNHHEYYDTYANHTIKITQENRKGNNVATWTLNDAYPKQIDPIQLDYGTNDAVMTCNATITYRDFDVVWHTLTKDAGGEKTYAKNENTDTSPVPQLMKDKIKKRTGILRITQDEFDKMYPGFDRMSQSEQNAILKLYGKDYIHAESSSGGALHMVNL